VNADDAPCAEALGLRCTNIIFFKDLQHRRTCHAGDDSQWHGAKNDRGQDEVMKGVTEGAFLARENGIDQRKTGDGGIEVLDEVNTAGDGCEVQRI
jgi:hypothetical protein